MLNSSKAFLNFIKKTDRADKSGNTAVSRSSQYLIPILGVGLILSIGVSAFTSCFSTRIPEWTGFGERVIEINKEEPDLNKIGVTKKETNKATTYKIQSSKTLWDWMSLFLAPATIVGLGYMFQNAQEQAKQDKEATERRRSEDQQREEALQSYFEQLSKLLSKETDPNKTTELAVIKARTFALFRMFDNSKDMTRKASVLSFLGDSGLLKQLQPSTNSSFNLEGSHWQGSNLRRVNLSEAKLRKADFSKANLSKTNLDKAKLRKANLSNADLSGSSLIEAELIKADLNDATLYKAKLNDAKLNDANLCRANLSKADLSNADLNGVTLHEAILLATNLRTSKSLTQKHLEGDGAPLLCNVALPPGMTVNPNRDCDCIPQVLLDKYPQYFANLEEAKRVVDEAKQKMWD